MGRNRYQEREVSGFGIKIRILIRIKSFFRHGVVLYHVNDFEMAITPLYFVLEKITN